MSRTILILGATSAIAQASARYFAADGARFVLVARDAAKLSNVADDLRVRGATQVETIAANLENVSEHEAILSKARAASFDTALIAYGTLGDQAACEKNYDETRAQLQTNLLSVVSFLTRLANDFETLGRGTIAVITSVAGDRGRRSNYVYGMSKGALNIFLSGLRNRLSKRGVSVITIKPGFVDTPMTAHLKKGLLFASADTVGKGVHSAIIRGADVVYLPWFWRWIMLIIRCIPETVFKKMRL